LGKFFALWELEFCGVGCWSIRKLLSSWEFDFCVLASLATYFLFNSEKKVGKETPPRLTQAFICKKHK